MTRVARPPSHLPLSSLAAVQVLQLALVHLDRKRRQALCAALHMLLPATDVVVQTTSFALLSRFYTLPSLLLHLDALEWEGLEPEREEEEEGVEGATPKQTADLLRALPAPLVRALRTAVDAAGGVSPAAAEEEVLMSTECLGVLLAWLLVLEFRPRCSTRLQGNVSQYLRNEPLLQVCCQPPHAGRLPRMCVCIQTCMHTYIYTHKRARARTHTHTHTHTTHI